MAMYIEGKKFAPSFQRGTDLNNIEIIYVNYLDSQDLDVTKGVIDKYNRTLVS